MHVFDARTLLAHTMTLMGYDTRELPGIRQAMEYVADQLANAGIPVQVLDFGGMPLLEAVVGPQGDGVRELWLHAHVDTVPLMAAGQATPRLEGQLLYGRGGYDMLGAVACFIEVMIALQRRPLRKCVRLVCVPDEETFGSGRLRAVRKGRQQPDVRDHGRAHRPQGRDPRARDGGARRDDRRGPAHSSRPDQARNPWLIVSDVLQAICARLPYARSLRSWYPAGPMLVPTAGGAATAVNTSPGTLTVAVSARLLPGQDPARSRSADRGDRHAGGLLARGGSAAVLPGGRPGAGRRPVCTAHG